MYNCLLKLKIVYLLLQILYTFAFAFILGPEKVDGSDGGKEGLINPRPLTQFN
jgi:hypothetical protein